MQLRFEWNTFLDDIFEQYPNDSEWSSRQPITQLAIRNRTFSGFLRKTQKVQSIEGLIGVFDSKSTFRLEIQKQKEGWSYIVFAIGNGTLTFNGTHYDLPRYFFANPDYEQIMIALNAHQSILLVIIRIESSVLSSLLDNFKIDDGLFQTPIYISSSVELLIKSLNNPQLDFMSILETHQKLIELFLAVFEEQKKAQKKEISTESFHKLQKIVEVLTKNYSSPEKPSIEKLAALINVSPSKLKSDFKAVYQESIYSYYLKRKLEYAAELLASQKYTVSQVAIKVGYQVQATKFVQIFRKYYQMTPKQYQLSKQKSLHSIQ